jgi:hypothetical protein
LIDAESTRKTPPPGYRRRGSGSWPPVRCAADLDFNEMGGFWFLHAGQIGRYRMLGGPPRRSPSAPDHPSHAIRCTCRSLRRIERRSFFLCGFGLHGHHAIASRLLAGPCLFFPRYTAFMSRAHRTAQGEPAGSPPQRRLGRGGAGRHVASAGRSAFRASMIWVGSLRSCDCGGPCAAWRRRPARREDAWPQHAGLRPQRPLPPSAGCLGRLVTLQEGGL